MIRPSSPLPFRVEKCPCGHPACTSANVRPVTCAWDVMEEKDAAYIAHAANVYPKLVEALRKLTDDARTMTAERIALDKARALLRELGEL